MKVYSIQNYAAINSTNKTCKPKQSSFKGALLANEIKLANYPKNAYEWADKFSKLINAAQGDSTVKIVNQNLFNELLKCRHSLDDLTIFIGKNIIDGMELGTSKVLAYDPYQNPAVALFKDIVYGEDRHFIQFYDTCHHAQLGLADANFGAKRFKFFKNEDLYVDFYEPRKAANDTAYQASTYSAPAAVTGNGGIRKISPFSGSATYYKEDGSRDYFGGLKSLFNMS